MPLVRCPMGSNSFPLEFSLARVFSRMILYRCWIVGARTVWRWLFGYGFLFATFLWNVVFLFLMVRYCVNITDWVRFSCLSIWTFSLSLHRKLRRSTGSTPTVSQNLNVRLEYRRKVNTCDVSAVLHHLQLHSVPLNFTADNHPHVCI